MSQSKTTQNRQELAVAEMDRLPRADNRRKTKNPQKQNIPQAPHHHHRNKKLTSWQK